MASYILVSAVRVMWWQKIVWKDQSGSSWFQICRSDDIWCLFLVEIWGESRCWLTFFTAFADLQSF